MSLFGDLFGEVMESVFGESSDTQAGTSEKYGLIEQLCGELEWPVDERDGNSILLYFQNPVDGRRKVRIIEGDGSIVTFISHSLAFISSRSVTAELLVYLLCRNIDGIGLGKWGMSVDPNKNVSFHVAYQALGGSLNAEALKYICESLVIEATDFDGKMREEGLL